MKTLVTLPEPKKTAEYPKLMHMPDVMIVLFLEHKKGLILKCNCLSDLYTMPNDFVMADFIDFDGEITLKND